MKIPIILGIHLHIWLGMLLFLLLVFQIAVAKRILHVNFKWHRINGYVMLLVALIHGIIGAGLYYGFFRY